MSHQYQIFLSPQGEKWVAERKASREEIENRVRQMCESVEQVGDTSTADAGHIKKGQMDNLAEISIDGGPRRSFVGYCMEHMKSDDASIMRWLIKDVDANAYDSSGRSLFYYAMVHRNTRWAMDLFAAAKRDPDLPMSRDDPETPLERLAKIWRERFRTPSEKDAEARNLRDGVWLWISPFISMNAIIPPEIATDEKLYALASRQWTIPEEWKTEWSEVEANLHKEGCAGADVNALAEMITVDKLKHFYTLDKLGELLQPEHWTGQEKRILDLMEQVPQCVSKHFTIELDVLHTFMQADPASQVGGAAAEGRLGAGRISEKQ